MNTLFLGDCDTGRLPPDTLAFLSPYHYLGILKGVRSFRDDDRSKWRRFRENAGAEVAVLQQFLFRAGFMPRGTIDGIFDYVTMASVRLFQEYVRTREGVTGMLPDGIVGRGTWDHINRWESGGKTADWIGNTSENPSEEYRSWMALLIKAKNHYRETSHPIVAQVAAFKPESDTLKIDDWNTDGRQIHLLGIRREQDKMSANRENDDLFILLIRGMVFKFWGSTDPSQAMAFNFRNKTGRLDEAFLVEGQHKYRFGWHKISEENKVYRALKPYRNGVLVFRDRDDDNALTEADLKIGIDPQPNQTINIHWSGIGNSNWSAGCQVIAGQSYINHHNEVVDCSNFAAGGYNSLSDSGKKTKGAYNVFTDLILSLAPAGTDYLYYTLGREKSLTLGPSFGEHYSGEMVKLMKAVKT
jgi:hypothetical protein